MTVVQGVPRTLLTSEMLGDTRIMDTGLGDRDKESLYPHSAQMRPTSKGAQELDRSERVSGVRSFLAGKVFSEGPGDGPGVYFVAAEGRNGASMVDFTQQQQFLTIANHSQLCDPESF